MNDSIAEWYRGRSVFITGGTGFIGKVILERLLRSCPDIGAIYVLCRPKRGLNPATRINEAFKLPLFEQVRKEKPEQLKKLVAVEGDLTKEGLGIESSMMRRLEAEVTVFINGGATLRLESDLKTAVEHNTAGTLRVLNVAARMTKLEAFIHLSTAFCHCDVEVLEEKMYPPPVSPHNVMQLVGWMKTDTIDALTPKLLGDHPNCYTFTKRLAETLVEEYAGRFPVSILRPSIVLPTIKEPVRGWVDTLNGPVGVLVGGGKGVIRSMLCDGRNKAEVVPVDIVANAVVAAAWHQKQCPKGVVTVYNVTSADKNPFTWAELVNKGKSIVYKHPFEMGLWYPNGDITMNPYKHALVVFLFQTVPAYLIDFLLFLARQKRFMVRVQKRISDGTDLLKYFTTRNWKFVNKNALSLENFMNGKERNTFYIGNIEYEVDEYMADIVVGSRIYCLKEPLESLPKARFHLKIQYYLDCFAKGLIIVGFLYLTASYLLWISDLLFGAEIDVRHSPVTIK